MVKEKTSTGSVIDPSYSSGVYFTDNRRGSKDAKFKADYFMKLLGRYLNKYDFIINSFVDVGCGSGEIIKMIAAEFKKTNDQDNITFKAYDISPHVQNIKSDGIEFIYGDFCESDNFVDIVTLFDVFEHVPDTIQFIKKISQRCKVIGFHIPLDDSLIVNFRDLFHSKIQNPGHLVFLDTASALNLLAFSGLRVVDYEYTFGFLSPTGHSTIPQNILFPFRYLLAKINPWFLSKTIGGASLVVLAITPKGLKDGI